MEAARMIETANASRRVAALQRMLTGNNSKKKTMQYTQDHDTETESMCVGNEIREIQTKRWEEEEDYDVVKMDAEVTTMTNFEETTGAPAGVERERPAPGGGAGTLKVTDSRTGKKYEVRVSLSLSLTHNIDIYLCGTYTKRVSPKTREKRDSCE